MPLLEVKNLRKYFPVTRGIFLRRTGWVYALDGVSLSIKKGETLGVVGESGCGKTTLGRCIMGLYRPSSGKVIVQNQDVSMLDAGQRKTLYLHLQMIFQDPFESLSPRQTVKEILEEKFIIHKQTKNLPAQLKMLLDRVGLSSDALNKFPHEFSGGQRQRIGIARAISLEPDLIVCDEPVSALDVSVQSKILNLLLELQQTMGLAFLFISHDLSVVKHISDKIAVMYLGKIVETGDARTIYQHCCHPYTKALYSSIPVPDPEAKKAPVVLHGEVPSVEHPPEGCRFNTRCPHAEPICFSKEPLLTGDPEDPGHLTACHLFF
jgi:oligopeptide/dipeptide ABC transporter ATP-binding protein